MKQSTILYIKDLVKDFKLHDSQIYLDDVYKEFPQDIKSLFIYFHAAFNGLFDFMNYKSQSNRHFNADESRELFTLIHSFTLNSTTGQSIGFGNLPILGGQVIRIGVRASVVKNSAVDIQGTFYIT